jgi:hypothetical protein
MSDVFAVIDGMSWWVKSGWLVWLAWLGLQVAWYRWNHLAAADTVAAAPPERLGAARPAPVVTPHRAADAGVAPAPSHRRRRRARRAPEVATALPDGVEAVR